MGLEKQTLLILVLAGLLILTLINIYWPFITTHPAEKANKVVEVEAGKNIKNKLKQEFADIEEESLIKYNNKSEKSGFNTDRQMVTEDNTTDTRLVVNEGFDATLPIIPESHEFRLFFRPDCSYSMAFMPIWLELLRALPSNVTPKEINCGTVDSNGVSLCANYLEYGGGITSVPSIQLASNINGTKKIQNYTGQRSYKNIEEWLGTQGVVLKYNPDAEHFDDSNPVQFNMGAKEGFTVDEVELPEGSPGKMARDLKKAYLDMAQQDKYGNVKDIGDDGFYKASFSTCRKTADGPEGYQVFTRRGQWGCVVPDPKTGIATPFDAAFAAVDSYLNHLPTQINPVTNELQRKPISETERMALKKGMAKKHAKEIRAFGLCDEKALRDKYNVYDRVKAGRAKLPPGIKLDDYLDTKESAAAIYEACSI